MVHGGDGNILSGWHRCGPGLIEVGLIVLLPTAKVQHGGIAIEPFNDNSNVLLVTIRSLVTNLVKRKINTI